MSFLEKKNQKSDFCWLFIQVTLQEIEGNQFDFDRNKKLSQMYLLK